MPRALSTRFLPVCTTIASLLATVLVIAGCGASGQTFTSPSTSTKCAVTTSATASTLPAGGGAASIAVSTARDCQWTASVDGSWLTITGGASGQGPGTVDVTAAANAAPATRTAAVVVNDQRVSLTQAAAACHFDLSGSAASMPSTGGRGSVDVRASNAACTWTASSDASWLTIASGASGSGSATVTFDVAPAPGVSRSGTLTIAGLRYTVQQSEACTYSLSTASYAAPPNGGSTTVTVTAGEGCPWTAASSTSWLSVTPASGSGAGPVTVTVAPASGGARSGTATIAGQTFTVTQSQACTVAIAPATASIGAGAESGRIDVTAGAGCAWAAASSAPWLSITSGATGSGDGAVLYAAAANTGSARSGSITVGDRTFTLTQAGGCTVSLSSLAQSVDSGGTTTTVGVTSGTGCAWTASSNASWIAVSSGNSGSGNGTVQLTIAANGDAARTGTVMIGGQTFTVTQAGGCTVSLSSTAQSVDSGGTTTTVGVTSGTGCAWTASSNASWITVSNGSSGSGNGSVQLAIAANVGAARTGSVTIGGQTFTVTQAAAPAPACTFQLSSAGQSFPSTGGPGSVALNTMSGCAWTASSDAAWIALTPSSGSGAGTVSFTVSPNTGARRSGTIRVADQVFTVSQDAAPVCTFTVSPTSADVGSEGGKGTVTVHAADGCAWTARSNVPWITITSGDGGTGDGAVKYSVDRNPNDGPPRTGTMTVAGQTVTISQKQD